MQTIDIIAVAVMGIFALLGATRLMRAAWGALLGLALGALLLGFAGAAMQRAPVPGIRFVPVGKVIPYLTERAENVIESVQHFTGVNGGEREPASQAGADFE